jgi:hypothetical protein
LSLSGIERPVFCTVWVSLSKELGEPERIRRIIAFAKENLPGSNKWASGYIAKPISSLIGMQTYREVVWQDVRSEL